MDIISPAMSMDKYDGVMAPAYLLQPGYAARVEVAKGGTFLTTFFSGIVDENDRVVLEAIWGAA